MSTRVLETVTRYLDKAPCRTAEQMTAICCKTAEAVQCCEKVEVWDGYSDEELAKKLNLNLDAEGRDEQGRYVEIRRIPRSKPCGEKVTRYDVRPRGCCDEAPPMGWDTAATPEVLPAGAAVWLYATGGIPPFTFSVASHGLYFDDGRRSLTTNARFARLHAGETFCGMGAVKVTDGCSTAVMELRSDLGTWYSLGSTCALPGADVSALGGYTANVGTLVFGRYRQVEYIQTYPGSFWSISSEGLHTVAAKLAAVEAARPPGARMNTCMYFNPYTTWITSPGLIIGLLADGAPVTENLGWLTGLTTRTYTISLSEWRC